MFYQISHNVVKLLKTSVVFSRYSYSSGIVVNKTTEINWRIIICGEHSIFLWERRIKLYTHILVLECKLNKLMFLWFHQNLKILYFKTVLFLVLIYPIFTHLYTTDYILIIYKNHVQRTNLKRTTTNHYSSKIQKYSLI